MAFVGRKPLKEFSPNHPFAGSGIAFGVRLPETSAPAASKPQPEQPEPTQSRKQPRRGGRPGKSR